MYNPFYHSIKAEYLISAEEIHKLFVLNRIWDKVKEPVNQIICGARGTGKSILLKRLSTRSMLYETDFRKEPKFIGVYISISKIARGFDSILSHFSSSENGGEKKYFQKVFEHYLFLSIIEQLIKDLIKIFHEKGITLDYETLRKSIYRYEFSLLNKFLNEDKKELRDVLSFLGGEKEKIVTYLSSWTGNKLSEFNPFSIQYSLDQGVQDIIKIYNYVFKKDIPVYLLLDVSYGISEECEEVVNSTLQRGFTYRTKLTVRPYDWGTFTVFEGRALEINNDFLLLPIEYPEEYKNDYKTLLEKMLNRLIEVAIEEGKDGWENASEVVIQTLFQKKKNNNYYAGFESLCELSSENPQDALLICSKIFDDALKKGINPIQGISPEIQNSSIINHSKDNLRSTGGKQQRGIRLLLNKIERAKIKGNSIKVIDGQEGLFEEKEKRYRETLKFFFTHGLFRFRKEDDIHLKQVPRSFNISKIFFPVKNLDLEGEGALSLPFDFIIKDFLSEPHGKPSSIERKTPLKAFLSTSFIKKVGSTEQRRLVKGAFKKIEIGCYDIEELPKDQLLLDTIKKYIERYDFTVVDITEPRPNVMFEMGLSAGFKKPITFVFNKDSKGKIEDLPDYITQCYIAPYTFGDPASMAESCKNDFYNLSKGQFFEKTTKSRSRLHVKKDKKTIYLSYPKERKIWDAVYQKVCNKLEIQGYRVINERNAPYDAKSLQKPIFCISLAKYVFVDTTGLDFLQCYKLGICDTQKRVHGMRIEEEGEGKQKDLLWQEPYATWKDVDSLIKIISDFIKSKEKVSIKK